MKKIIRIITGVLLVSSLSACGGKVGQAKTHEVDSKMYSQEDISAAIELVKKEFKHSFKGCTLTEIYYAGDENTKNHQGTTAQHAADEVIVLLSSFDVGPSGGDGSLNPNDSYTDWMWILARKNGGRWKHVDHGY